MSISTLVNQMQTAIGRRPASLAAAASLPIASLWAVDYSFGKLLPNELAPVGLFIMCGMEFLQWTSFGRLSALNDARAEAQATALKRQMLILALFQVVGYTLTIVGIAPAWGTGWALAGVVGFASLFAYLNVTAKWTSADAPEAYIRRTASGLAISVTPALPSPDQPPPGDRVDGDNVYAFNRPNREIAGYGDERAAVRELIQQAMRDQIQPKEEAKPVAINSAGLPYDKRSGRFCSLRDLDNRTGDLFTGARAA